MGWECNSILGGPSQFQLKRELLKRPLLGAVWS